MMLVLLVLCSGLFQGTLANRLRVFKLTGELNRENALKYCSDTNMSLVTLYDEADANFMQHFEKKTLQWLGLRRHHRNISSWSNNKTVKFNRSNVNQLNLQDDQRCEAINNGSWTDRNCSERLAFMCYKGNSGDNMSYVLVQNPKNWCQARLFCRRHYTDLVSISSPEQNIHVTNQGEGQTFWIGLIHDQWKWEDNGCSAYRNWVQNPRPFNYTAQSVQANTINKVAATELFTKVTVCSKGKVRIIHNSSLLTWEEAFHYCNSHHTGLLWIEEEEDQKTVTEWLQYSRSESEPLYYWIGLRQSRVFGFWIWMSDRMVSYSNWENGTQPMQPLSHQCGAISGQTFQWTDKNCLLRLPFLCEEEISFMNP